mgnify:CR=1 FL=1
MSAFSWVICDLLTRFNLWRALWRRWWTIKPVKDSLISEISLTFLRIKTLKNFIKKKFDCCDYIDTYERFEETYLPPKQAFYNRLKNNTFPRKIRHTFKQCNKNLHDKYRRTARPYVFTDVLLLADVFERFRDMTLDYYMLDACHYFTSLRLAWDAALKMTGVSLELITEPLMYNLLLLCGIVSTISKNKALPTTQILRISIPRRFLATL